MNKLANLCLAITSLSFPILVLAFIYLDSLLILILIALLLALMAHLLLIFSIKELEVIDLQIDDFTNKDFACLWVFSTLLVPLASKQIDVDPIILTLIVILLLGVLYKSIGFIYNPLLVIFGWHYFAVKLPQGGEYILITKKKIINKEDTFRASELFDYVLISKE